MIEKDIKKIPKHWKWVTLDDIGIVVGGGTPSTKEPEFWNGNIPWVTPADLSNYEEIYIAKGKRNISQMGLDYSSAYLLPEDSVIFSTRAPIGYVAITKKKLATSQGFKNLIISTELVNPKYIFYYLKTIKELAENMASGTTFLELSARKFREIPFPLSPTQEQADIVDKVEELFSELSKSNSELVIAKNKTIVLFKSILNNAFTNKKIKFNKVDLQSITLKITDGSHFSPKTVSKGFPYITVRDINNDRIDFENCKKIDEESFLKLKSSGCSPFYNDLLFSKDGTVGKVLLNDYKEEFVVLSSLAIITPDLEKVLPKYLYYYLKSDLFLNQALSNKRGVAIKRLVLKDLRELMLKIPSLNFQQDIINQLEESIDYSNKLLLEIEKSIDSNKALSKKILQDAYSGKLTSQIKYNQKIEILIKKISEDKEELLKKINELSRSHVKQKKTVINLSEIIYNNFKNQPFAYSDLYKISKISKLKLAEEFEKLERLKEIESYFDKESETLKFKLI